jgi:hypothetical protein
VQTERGQEAKATTTQEFADVLKVAKAKARHLGLQPARWSWDHSHVHDHLDVKAVWEDEDIETFPLAHYMPDGHKVIEHCFSTIKAAFHRRLFEDKLYKTLTSEKAQNLLRDITMECITAKRIANDCKSLKTTLGIISTPCGQQYQDDEGTMHPGTGGGWAPKRYR